MGVRKDLKRARQRTDLAARTRVELTRDERGVVREAGTLPLAPRPTTGSTADLPFTNAAEAPTPWSSAANSTAPGTPSPRPPSQAKSPPRQRG